MAAAIPWIALSVSAAGTGASAYNQYKANKTAKAAQQSVSDTAAGQLGLQRELFASGAPMLNQAGSYWTTLLRGSRGAMSQATAGPRSAINDQYRGAATNLERSGVRGGVKDVSLAELSRDRAGKVAALTSGVQPAAAQNLSEIGGKFLGVGSQAGSTGAGLYSSLMGSTQQAAQYAGQNAGQAGSAFGSLLFDLLKSKYGQGGSGGEGQSAWNVWSGGKG